MNQMAYLRATKTGIEIDLWVQPRASRAVLGPLDAGRDRLRAAVTSPPVEGAANTALRELLCDSLDVSKSQVTILRGSTGRTKTVAVTGPPEDLLARIRALAKPAPSS